MGWPQFCRLHPPPAPICELGFYCRELRGGETARRGRSPSGQTLVTVRPAWVSGPFPVIEKVLVHGTTKACTRSGKSASRRPDPARRGNIIVLSAFMMVIMMAMLALAVDVGYIYTMQAQLQRPVDAAALAGAGELVEGIDAAQATATEYLVRNPVGSSSDGFIDDAAWPARSISLKRSMATTWK